ncbi:MAG: M23 family metallopeptidase [Pseudomonadota bacterium]
MILHRLIPALGLFSLIATPALAETIKLSLPVACNVGSDCWIIQYPDVDPGPDARDFAGFGRTYEGHKGTDIGVSDVAAMHIGVTVLAPADGRVLRLRNDMADQLVDSEETRAAVQDSECGNGVIIDHGQGVETQLCHLRQGSIQVRADDQVKRGEPIGEIGLSGLTAFPHLHMTVRRDGVVVDPATGEPIDQVAENPTTENHLWDDSVLAAYGPADIVQIGFSSAEISLDEAIEGLSERQNLGQEPPSLILWGTLYGVQAGDHLRMQVVTPDGQEFFNQEQTLDETKIRWFQYAGRRIREPLAPGFYTGTITITRTVDGDTIKNSRETTIEIFD